jgi:hypothetical protein
MCELDGAIMQATFDFFGRFDHPECQARVAEALQEMREIVGANKYHVRRVNVPFPF